MPKEFLTPKEYSEITGIPLATVRRWLRDGKLAHLPKPTGVRQYRIPRTALNAKPSEKLCSPSMPINLNEYRKKGIGKKVEG